MPAKFPLFLRGDGRWAKKIGGVPRYFGRDKAEAEKRYCRQIGQLLNGQEPDPEDPDAAIRLQSVPDGYSFGDCDI